MIDEATDAGARAARRLREERIAWLTTVDANGAPRPVPVWFLWDGEEVLVYSEPGRAKLRNVAQRPRVALHFDSDGEGSEIVILNGEARVSDDPPADRVEAFVAKYDWGFRRNGWTAAQFAARYSVALRIGALRVSGAW